MVGLQVKVWEHIHGYVFGPYTACRSWYAAYLCRGGPTFRPNVQVERRFFGPRKPNHREAYARISTKGLLV